MPDLRIDNVPQDEIDAIESRAARHGRSQDEELRHLIHEAAAEEQLVQKLEQAQRATDALRTAERNTERTASAQNAPVAAPPRRRYRSVEPTPRKR